jgi:negative regulator of sigma E activity
MDCAQFEELVHDLDRPGTEGFARREAALTHAESCSRCAILVMQSESLDVALQALSKRESAREASPVVAATLMEEFQRHKFASLGRRVSRQVAALGAAAAVLLAVGFWLHFLHSQTPPIAINEQPSVSVASSPAPAQVPANANSAQPSAPAATPSTVPSSPTNVQRASLEAESQNDAAFIRLPYSDDPGSLDDDAVVRVVLTPATLASFGLPVTGLGSSESVQADLAVSQDGMPQAVRLVSGTSSNQEF